MATDKKASAYMKQTEESLVHYINSGHFTLSQAHEYMVKLVDTIFGNDNHTGIYEYIQSNFKEMDFKGDELVQKCEALFTKGWRVIEKKGKFYLVDDSMKVLADVSGPQTILEPEEEEEVMELSQENAYLFMSEKDATALVKASIPLGIDPINFKSASLTYNFVYDHTGGAESKLFPLAQSYVSMSKILARMTYFPYVKELLDITEFYMNGFKLANDVINPTEFARAAITNGGRNYILTPVRPDVIGKYKQDELAIIQAFKKRDALKDLGVDVEIPVQVGEKGQTFALAFEDKREYTQVQDIGEIVRILDSVEANHSNKSYPKENYNKIMQNICAIAVIEAILFGNGRFSLGDITIDTVTPKITVRYTGKVTTHTPQEILNFLNSSISTKSDKPVLEALLSRLSFKNPEFKGNFPVILAHLPQNFRQVVEAIDLSDLPQGFDAVKTRLLQVIK